MFEPALQRSSLDPEFGAGGHDAFLLEVAGSGVLTNKCDVELDTVFDPGLQRSSLDPEAGVNEVTSRALLVNSSSLHTRIGRLDSSISAHVSSHARAPVPLTVSCLARPAVVAAVASPVVSRARSYAQVAAAACDDAVALHESSLCSRNSGGTGGLLPVHCMIVPCVLVIQAVLVVSCLCRDPPVTAWIIHGWAVIHAEKCDKAALSGAGLSCRP